MVRPQFDGNVTTGSPNADGLQAPHGHMRCLAEARRATKMAKHVGSQVLGATARDSPAADSRIFAARRQGNGCPPAAVNQGMGCHSVLRSRPGATGSRQRSVPGALAPATGVPQIGGHHAPERVLGRFVQKPPDVLEAQAVLCRSILNQPVEERPLTKGRQGEWEDTLQVGPVIVNLSYPIAQAPQENGAHVGHGARETNPSPRAPAWHNHWQNSPRPRRGRREETADASPDDSAASPVRTVPHRIHRFRPRPAKCHRRPVHAGAKTRQTNGSRKCLPAGPRPAAACGAARTQDWHTNPRKNRAPPLTAW